MAYVDVTRVPDEVNVQSDDSWYGGATGSGELERAGFLVEFKRVPSGLRVALKAERPVSRAALLWKCEADTPVRILGDHWERGYGDLEWRGIVPDRDLPWYMLYTCGGHTHGAGVMTGPAALCHWRMDAHCVTLVLDVRCGGMGVELGGRNLEMATIVSREGQHGENAFAAAQSFCRCMCPAPRMPAQPVYGGNDWYFSYGHSTHASILENAGMLAQLAEGLENRPFYVVDMNWHSSYDLWHQTEADPWTADNPDFPDMAKLARDLKSIGMRPGLWFRPLITSRATPGGWLLEAGRVIGADADGLILDPSVPEALEAVRGYMRRFVDWGYEMVKYDFTTYDLMGRWGFHKPCLAADGWSFRDRSKTTAEIVLGLYRALREAAGDKMLIGCNTFSHLAAGLVELQRTGDDTSGREWERTRKMGINTMAFRAPQHGAFYAADADCVAITPDAPWELSRLWLELVANSGTPLFVSANPQAMGDAQKQAVSEAFAIAAQPHPCAEPLDWQDNASPAYWRFGGGTRRFDWTRYGRFDYCGL